MKRYVRISPVWRTSVLTRRRYFVTVGNRNHEFATEREAWKFRSERVRERERSLRFDYDRTAAYISIAVTPPPLEQKRRPWLGWFWRPNAGLGVSVDAEAYEQGVQHACATMAADGYEILAVTPLTSGVGSWRMNHYHASGAAAGWGSSMTQGVLITAKKLSKSTD